MAGSKTSWFKIALMDHVLGAQTWTPPANFYVAASTQPFDPDATATAMDEVSSSGTGYARVLVTNDLTSWDSAAEGGGLVTKTNLIDFVFPVATADWGDVASIYLCDDPVAGNALYGMDLESVVPVPTGGQPHVPSGLLQVQE